jgi:hypothetical protein
MANTIHQLTLPSPLMLEAAKTANSSLLKLSPCPKEKTDRFQKDEADLMTYDIPAKICTFLASWLFDPDPEKVSVWGSFRDDHESGVQIIIWEHDKSVWHSISVNGVACHAEIHLKPLEGFEVHECIRLDFLTPITEFWLNLLGLPRDFPCGVQCVVNRNGALELEIVSCM